MFVFILIICVCLFPWIYFIAEWVFLFFRTLKYQIHLPIQRLSVFKKILKNFKDENKNKYLKNFCLHIHIYKYIYTYIFIYIYIYIYYMYLFIFMYNLSENNDNINNNNNKNNNSNNSINNNETVTRVTIVTTTTMILKLDEIRYRSIFLSKFFLPTNQFCKDSSKYFRLVIHNHLGTHYFLPVCIYTCMCIYLFT